MTALVTPALVVVALALLSAQQEPVARRPNAVPPTEKPIVDNYATFAVGPVPASFGYDATFYKKYVDAHGIPIISSEKVPDAALLMARDIVIYMIANRPDIRAEMIAKKYRVGIMAITEMTTDIPEQRDRKKPGPADPRLTRGERENYDKPGGIGGQTDKEYWDRRARGLGGVYTERTSVPGREAAQVIRTTGQRVPPDPSAAVFWITLMST